jgi:hypothetical protein
MSYGYDAYTHNRRQLSDMTIYDHAEALVAALAVERRKTDVRRITLIQCYTSHSHTDGTTTHHLCGAQSRWNSLKICRLSPYHC